MRIKRRLPDRVSIDELWCQIPNGTNRSGHWIGQERAVVSLLEKRSAISIVSVVLSCAWRMGKQSGICRWRGELRPTNYSTVLGMSCHLQDRRGASRNQIFARLRTWDLLLGDCHGDGGKHVEYHTGHPGENNWEIYLESSRVSERAKTRQLCVMPFRHA